MYFFRVELISRRDIKNACTRADDTFADLRLMATVAGITVNRKDFFIANVLNGWELDHEMG